MTEQIIKKIKTVRPVNVTQLRRICKLKRMGSGAFRRAYSIIKTDAIVKFSFGADGISHTQDEIKNIRKIKTVKRFQRFKKYLPKIYYWDETYGVIIMEQIQMNVTEDQASKIKAKFEKMFPKGGFTDLHKRNVGRNKKGQIKVIDFGVIGGQE